MLRSVVSSQFSRSPRTRGLPPLLFPLDIKDRRSPSSSGQSGGAASASKGLVVAIMDAVV